MATATIAFTTAPEPEDRLRADLYALFARLYFAAPDAALLRTMGHAPLLSTEDHDESRLAIAWTRLAAASRAMDPEAAAEEFDALFGGVGRSLIPLFGSYYISISTPGTAGQFLVDVRAELSGLGFALHSGQSTPEDHCSALFETMRLMITGDDETSPRSIDQQQRFFKRFIAPWFVPCCSAIRNSSVANFYRTVAECTEAFLAIEDDALAIA